MLEELAQRSAERGVWVLRGQAVDQMAQRPLRILDGALYTPPLEDRILDSITRRALFAVTDAAERITTLDGLMTRV